MKLLLSHNSPLNSTFYNAETRLPLYQTSTPFGIGIRHTTIRKIRDTADLSANDIAIPELNTEDYNSVMDETQSVKTNSSNHVPHGEEEVVGDENDNSDDAASLSMTPLIRDADVLAEIHWNALGSTKVLLPGATEEVRGTEFLSYAGQLHMFDPASRAFTGPDGRSYRWSPSGHKYRYLTLELNDGSKTPIARSYSPTLLERLQASKKRTILEIFAEEREDVRDAIVIAFIYMENVRRDYGI